MSQDGKLEKSVMNFKAANPKWMPSDQAGSVFVQKMSDSIMPSSRRNGGIKSPEFGLGEVYEDEREQHNLEDGFGGDADKGMLKMLQQFSFTRNHSNNFPKPF